jgi:NAD(P)-dependent dehydrogenase (short-subunit alcohol dehydrogenase family)
MAGRLDGKIAIIAGAGQTPGETIGNGRATALLFAREGAQLLLVDRRTDSAEETAELVRKEGGTCEIFTGDITDEETDRAIAAAALDRFGRIDILHNNVGIGAGDAGPTTLTEESWHRIMDVNLTGPWLLCKHVLPPMREQQSGVITNISSVAAIASTPMLAYKVSKAGLNALTQALAGSNARYGVRVNAIRSARTGPARCLCSTSRGVGGTPPMRLCSWQATRRSTSPVSCCRWTAGCTSRWDERGALGGRCRDASAQDRTLGRSFAQRLRRPGAS